MSEKNIKKIVKTIIGNGEPISLWRMVKETKIGIKIIQETLTVMADNNYLVTIDDKYWIRDYYIGVLQKESDINIFYVVTPIGKIFINKSDLNRAELGDLVIIKFKAFNNDIMKGKVVKVKEQNKGGDLGTVILRDGKVVVINNKTQEIIIEPDNPNNISLVTGHQVIIKKINGIDKPVVMSVEGHNLTPTGDIKSIMENYGISMFFPKEVIEEAQKISQSVLEDDIKGRLDLRNMMIITIDGDKTTDFDDAISYETLSNGNHLLGIHISHVSHYVKEDSLIFKEAVKRAFSNYSEGKCVPLMPWELTSGICSLSEGVDRLTKSYFVEIDNFGNKVNYLIAPSVIRSNKRMTYKKVSEILNGEAVYDDYLPFVGLLTDLKKLSDIIRINRNQKSVQFNFPKTEFVFSPSGDVIDITSTDKLAAENMIEDFMLVANQIDTIDKLEKGQLCIFRNHNHPKPEDINKLTEYLKNEEKINLKGENVDLHNFLLGVKDLERRQIYSSILLFCMEKANYSTINMGHYALGFDATTHATSPIRRVVDLLQQFISDNNYSNNSEKAIRYEEYVKYFSTMEIKYQKLERTMFRYYCCEYMKSRVGERYFGKIFEINSRGIYVDIYNGVMGFINIRQENNARIDKNAMLLYYDGNKYKLGDQIEVEIKSVSYRDFSIGLQINRQLNPKVRSLTKGN